VVITGRTASTLAAAKAEIEGEVPGTQVLPLDADNKDHGAAQDVVAKTVQKFGRLDILVNNAQEFHTMIAVEDYSWEDFIYCHKPHPPPTPST